MKIRQTLRSAAVAAAAALGVLAVGVPAAIADASGPASCVGIEASAISPPGSSEEFPGGMPDVVRFVSQFGTFGPQVSQFAQLHEGSHEGCDAAEGGG